MGFSWWRARSRRNDAARHPDTPARAAAAALPTAEEAAAQTSGESAGERAVTVIIGVVTFLGVAIWALLAVGTQLPHGWILVAAGLPTWLVARWLFFRLRGSQTATCTVDADGVIHVLTGHGSIRQMARMFDVGVRSWFRAGTIAGVLIGLLLPIGIGALAVLFDTPAPAAVFLTAFGFAALDFVRYLAFILLWPWFTGQTRLDSGFMLPAMAIYARHHGWRPAVSGLPADQLAATLTAHPDELDIAHEYRAAVTVLAAITRGETP